MKNKRLSVLLIYGPTNNGTFNWLPKFVQLCCSQIYYSPSPRFLAYCTTWFPFLLVVLFLFHLLFWTSNGTGMYRTFLLGSFVRLVQVAEIRPHRQDALHLRQMELVIVQDSLHIGWQFPGYEGYGTYFTQKNLSTSVGDVRYLVQQLSGGGRFL
jgi:hypothetical protein